LRGDRSVKAPRAGSKGIDGAFMKTICVRATPVFRWDTEKDKATLDGRPCKEIEQSNQ
jgi:hypothetical protein